MYQRRPITIYGLLWYTSGVPKSTLYIGRMTLNFGQHCPINIQEALIKPRRVATRGGISPGVSYLQQRGRGLFAGGEEENQIC